VGHDRAPGWFGWIIPTGDGGVRAGIGSSNAVKPIACYRRLTQLFPRLFDGIESCRLYGGTIPLDFAPRSYADNVLLVGDAAGQVKPFSGGGIYTGLVAARQAAAAVLRAFVNDDCTSAAVTPRFDPPAPPPAQRYSAPRRSPTPAARSTTARPPPVPLPTVTPPNDPTSAPTTVP